MKNNNGSEDKDKIKELVTEANVNVKEYENKESSYVCLDSFEQLNPSYELGYN